MPNIKAIAEELKVLGHVDLAEALTEKIDLNKIKKYPVVKNGKVKLTIQSNGFTLRTPRGFMPVMHSEVEKDSGSKFIRTIYRDSYVYDIYKFIASSNESLSELVIGAKKSSIVDYVNQYLKAMYSNLKPSRIVAGHKHEYENSIVEMGHIYFDVDTGKTIPGWTGKDAKITAFYGIETIVWNTGEVAIDPILDGHKVEQPNLNSPNAAEVNQLIKKIVKEHLITKIGKPETTNPSVPVPKVLQTKGPAASKALVDKVNKALRNVYRKTDMQEALKELGAKNIRNDTHSISIDGISGDQTNWTFELDGALMYAVSSEEWAQSYASDKPNLHI